MRVPQRTGLRAVGGNVKLRNDSKQVAKVDVRIAPGDVLDVPDGVAAQLQAQSTHFVPSDGPVGSVPEPEPEATDAEESAVAEPEAKQAAPAKRAGKRSTRRS